MKSTKNKQKLICTRYLNGGGLINYPSQTPIPQRPPHKERKTFAEAPSLFLVSVFPSRHRPPYPLGSLEHFLFICPREPLQMQRETEEKEISPGRSLNSGWLASNLVLQFLSHPIIRTYLTVYIINHWNLESLQSHNLVN